MNPPVPPASAAQRPVRWKQFLMTWSVIYPLVLFVPAGIAAAMAAAGLPAPRWLTTLIGTAFIVMLMVYLIMPRYTRLLHGWPFAGSGRREIGSLNGQAFSLAKEFAIVIE